MVDVTELTKTIAALAAAPPADLPEPERAALFGAATQLRDAIQSPLEATLKYSFAVYETAALKLASDMNLFDVTVPAGGPLNVTAIAEKLSADPQLIGRILRILTGMGLFGEAGVEKYVAKPNAAVYCTGSPLKEALIHLGSQAPAAARLPEYFEKNGYKNPGDAFDGPWQFAENTTKHYFDWLSERPVLQNAFNLVMGISRMGQMNWFDMYPVADKLKVSSPDENLLVDIGGGMGHDVVDFRKKFPDLPGKVAFSDLPAVVDAGKSKGLPAGIEGYGHDFFQPHPEAIKGAKAYYLRTVLHDWPDKQARVIVKNVKDLMTKDSILLINENVLPEQGTSLYQAQLDLSMMVCFSSLDRTEKQFKELLESEGLKLVQSYKPPVNTPGAPTLLEFVLA